MENAKACGRQQLVGNANLRKRVSSIASSRFVVHGMLGLGKPRSILALFYIWYVYFLAI